MRFLRSMKFTALTLALVLTSRLVAQEAAKPADSPWGDFVEKDFPFFSSVLDCRDLGEGFPKDNLTPRGLILNLGHNLWACFDTDLLRIACIWEGEPGKPPVTPAALAPGSYHVAGQKTKDGQEDLPKPIGKVFLSNALCPSWQFGEKADLNDPREPAPSPEEIGRGPLPGKKGRLLGVNVANGVAVISTELDGIVIHQILGQVNSDANYRRVVLEYWIENKSPRVGRGDLFRVLGFQTRDNEKTPIKLNQETSRFGDGSGCLISRLAVNFDTGTSTLTRVAGSDHLVFRTAVEASPGAAYSSPTDSKTLRRLVDP
ncbi:MAG: hypothetical protein JNG86_04530, partial [Verrucomicrobiaceae bacterium]|nr:hypothetical protein [Verrucomicrobiaceae bacterium]